MREVRGDYEVLEEAMARWELENCHQPFSKNVVTILGTTSSGKVVTVQFLFISLT